MPFVPADIGKDNDYWTILRYFTPVVRSNGGSVFWLQRDILLEAESEPLFCSTRRSSSFLRITKVDNFIVNIVRKRSQSADCIAFPRRTKYTYQIIVA